MISCPLRVQMCQPRAISRVGLPVGRRVAIIAAMDGASGDFSMPMFAARKDSRSFAGDRSAPAPAKVGRAQLDTWRSLASGPGGTRYFIHLERGEPARVVPRAARI